MSMNASSRRDFLKKTAYVAPLILTMNVSLAAAQVGSARRDTDEVILLAPLAETQGTSLQGDSNDFRRGRGHRRFRGVGRRHRHGD